MAVASAAIASLFGSSPAPASPQAPAAGTAALPQQVVVKYARSTTIRERIADELDSGASVGGPGPGPRTRLATAAPGRSADDVAGRLREKPGVLWAVPDVIAKSGFFPNDPGNAGPGAWSNLQWNLLSDGGIDAIGAWNRLKDQRIGPGRGVKVAILDTGVAYKNTARFRRAPDFVKRQFVKGYDFVDKDREPLDENGHGTFVASIVAAQADNSKMLTGVAFGARIMPVRVLNADGEGTASDIASGLRYAAKKGAQVINLSLQFDVDLTESEIPEILAALEYAHSKGAMVVGASGNFADDRVALPARAPHVVAVGATTESKCLADYSHTGTDLDLVAPGGGDDASLSGEPRCDPTVRRQGIWGQTFRGSDFKAFGLRQEEGTSMATPHVSGIAALVVSSGILGKAPTPDAIEEQLEKTATPLGTAGFDPYYGNGFANATTAVSVPPAAGTTNRAA